MKKIRIFFYMLTALCMAGCTKLNVNVESQYTTANFPTNAASYAAVIGPLYTQLSYSKDGFSYAIDYWRMQEFSSDEAIIPARGGNYDDGGQYRQLHLHTWNPDHVNVVSNWKWGFSGIIQANSLLNLFAAAPPSSTKPAAIAEVVAMRSLFYYFMMDLYGNIPIVDTFPSTNPPTAKRADVFNFIEKSLKSALPNLSTATGAATYGHATKWMAFALLEKMYLNAEYYTGTPRYADAVAMADSILINSSYILSPSFAALFAPNNGPTTPETIMAVPYDPNLIPGQQFGRFGYLPFLQGKYGLPFRSSIAMSTIPDYYNNNFKQFPNDARDSLWLVGKQYNFDGSPVIVATTQKNLDATYTGADFNINWQLEITPNLTLVTPATMDIGNDILAQCKGIRSIKYYPDPTTNSNTRYAGNDVPLLRLGDVIMMKAEAILRGAAPTTVKGELQTALVLFNKIRARSKATLATTVTLDDILPERAREFSWEAWRRNDLIRFGKFETDWGFKTAAATAVNPTPQIQPTRRIYPVPTTELALNPKLVQNPGY